MDRQQEMATHVRAVYAKYNLRLVQAHLDNLLTLLEEDHPERWTRERIAIIDEAMCVLLARLREHTTP